MSDENELKPCPFCGVKPWGMYPDGDMEGYSVVCEHEEGCPVWSFDYESDEAAIEAWNQRAHIQQPQWQPHLVNRGDGVDGHYCICRMRPDGTSETWTGSKWASAGMVIDLTGGGSVEPAIPEGYALVPIEPTDAMLRAAQDAWIADPLRRSSTIIKAIIKAAPKPKEEA